MTEETKRVADEQTPDNPVPESNEAPEQPTDAELSEAAEPALEEQLDAERDKNLRLQAELRNVRARAQREQREALQYAEAGFAKELLVVLDDLERAREAAAGETADLASAREGFRLVYEQFLKVLRDHKIEQIAAVGEPFDPDLHEALLQQPSDEYEPGVVLQEIARGYRMHGRVIRPARVVVSSGAPEGAEGEE